MLPADVRKRRSRTSSTSSSSTVTSRSSVPLAGNFVYFGATPPEFKDQGEPPVYIPQPQAKKKVTGVIDWKRDHPILRHLALGNHAFADPIKLTVPPEAEVLMEGPTGPLMVLYRDKSATHFVMAFDMHRKHLAAASRASRCSCTT